MSRARAPAPLARRSAPQSERASCPSSAPSASAPASLANRQVDLVPVGEPPAGPRALLDDLPLEAVRGSLPGHLADLAVGCPDPRPRLGQRLADHARHLAGRLQRWRWRW